MRQLMNRCWRAVRRRLAVKGETEAGMATAEYAVGTVAVVSLGGVLIKILTDPAFRDLIWRLIQWIFDLISKLIGG